MTTREKLAEAAKVCGAWQDKDTWQMQPEEIDALALLCSAADCGTVGEPEERVACKECMWWKAGLKDSLGQCRAHPPVTLLDQTVFSLWPETYADGFCGEGERR